MASGSDSPERARADRLADEYEQNRRERDLANARVEIRASMRSSTDEVEDTGVINMRVEDAQKRGELPKVESESPGKVTVWNVTYAAAKRVPPWGIVILGALVIVSYTLLRLAGVVRWP